MQPIWDAEKAAVAAKANRENMVNLDMFMVNNISWVFGNLCVVVEYLGIFWMGTGVLRSFWRWNSF